MFDPNQASAHPRDPIGNSRPQSLALVAFAVWTAASLLIGEMFPFSRVSMYAKMGDRSSGAIPVFLEDGRDANIRDFRLFAGGPVEDIAPGYRCRAEGGCVTYACSMEFIPRTDIEWMRLHWTETLPDGGTPVTYVYRLLTVSDGAASIAESSVVWRGLAWR